MSNSLEKQTYVYDLEQFQNFHSASFKNIETKKRRIFTLYHDYANDSLSINEFPKLIDFLENEVLTLIGYNNQSYDDLMLKHMIINKEMFTHGVKINEIVSSLKNLSDRIISAPKLEK